MSKDPITCHILDTVAGKPAAGVSCLLYKVLADDVTSRASVNLNQPEGRASTNADGRVARWDGTTGPLTLQGGTYKIRFETAEYYRRQGLAADQIFFPYVEVVFNIPNTPDAHYHIPLLLSNYSYSTYRGS